MLFSEIINEDGLETVASKTNISTVNLGYLLEEDFARLNRVKALGFLLILEREYKDDIDVTDLRDRIKKYYNEHRPVDDKVVMVPKNSVDERSFSFFKLFVILALVIGAYFLYTQGQLDSIIQNIEDKETFFDDKKALENNVTEEEANKVIVQASETEGVKIETVKIEPIVAPKVASIDLNEEVNSSLEQSTTEVLALNNTESNTSVEATVNEVSEELAVNQTEISDTVEESTTTEETVATTITTVNVNPTRGMLWFGFINLDTKKRREFMKKVSTPFKLNDNRWLLVTGHGYLDVIADEKTIELADNKKHYFYIDKNEIKELSKSEFRDLNGNRGW